MPRNLGRAESLSTIINSDKSLESLPIEFFNSFIANRASNRRYDPRFSKIPFIRHRISLCECSSNCFNSTQIGDTPFVQVITKLFQLMCILFEGAHSEYTLKQ